MIHALLMALRARAVEIDEEGSAVRAGAGGLVAECGGGGITGGAL